jgi:hypothetical protein
LKYPKSVITDILNRIERLDLSVKVILIIEDIDKFIDKKIYDSTFEDISRLIKSPSIKFVATAESEEYLDVIKDKIKTNNLIVIR